MIELRPFNTLGGADHGWLRARHHFSFASYEDADRLGWGALRVWNDDEIQPETGFVEYIFDGERHGYLVPAVGAIQINGVRVNARDGAAIREVERVTITALEDSEVVLVDAA